MLKKMIKIISIFIVFLIHVCWCTILPGRNVQQLGYGAAAGSLNIPAPAYRGSLMRARAMAEDGEPPREEDTDDFWVRFEHKRLEKMRRNLKKSLNVPQLPPLLPKPDRSDVSSDEESTMLRRRRQRVPENMPSFQWRTVDSMVTFNVLTNSSNFKRQMKQFDELEFFLCPADMTWLDYSRDIEMFQSNDFANDGCIRLPSPLENINLVTTVYDKLSLAGSASRRFTWMARMRFEQLYLESLPPQQLSDVLRWTIVSVVRYKSSKRAAEKKMFIPSPTVRI